MYVVKTANGTPWSHDKLTFEEAVISRDNAARRGLKVHITIAGSGTVIGGSPTQSKAVRVQSTTHKPRRP